MADSNSKSILRDRIKTLRSGITPEEKKEKDRLLYNNIMRSGVLNTAEWVYIYVSYGSEADTRHLIDVLLKSPCHRVLVPRVNGKEMEFYEIKDLKDLKPGYNGIPEPVCGNPVLQCNGIMFMPGLVFDKSYGRIGYGGGYYDRYLYRHRNNNFFKIGIAYSFQVLEKGSIEMEIHDIKPDIIITENALY